MTNEPIETEHDGDEESDKRAWEALKKRFWPQVDEERKERE